MDFEKQVQEIIKRVEHPAIKFSLLDLGLIREYQIKNHDVKIILAFPAMNIPIKDMLINSLKEPLEAICSNIDFEIDVMTLEERNKFFQLEAEGWKGM